MSSVRVLAARAAARTRRSMARSIASSIVCVGLDGDHVGARQHHLAHDGVAELEDRVDEPALLALDGLLVGGDVGHRADLLLGDERALLQALAREDDVGDADEQRDSDRSGGKCVRNQSSGVTRSAARSVCCTAYVFGATSPITKNRTICRTMPMTTPQRAERRPRAAHRERRAS